MCSTLKRVERPCFKIQRRISKMATLRPKIQKQTRATDARAAPELAHEHAHRRGPLLDTWKEEEKHTQKTTQKGANGPCSEERKERKVRKGCVK